MTPAVDTVDRMQTLAAIILAYWCWVVIQTVLNLARIPRLTARVPARGPLVSVIIPARNEERSIGSTVEGMLAQTYRELEVVVVDDRSTDATGAILESIATRDARLTVLHGGETAEGWLGKPWALHQGSLLAHGELLLFVDADIHYAPDAVGAMVKELERSGVAFLSVLPEVVMRGFWENALMPQLAIAALSLMPVWLANGSRSKHLALGGGPGNLVRRNAYETAGGHIVLRDAVIDDIGLARLIRSSGERTAIARGDSMVSVRMYHGLREIVDGFTKNTFAAFDRSYVLAVFAMIFAGVFNLLPYLLAPGGSRLAIAAILMIVVSRVILFSSLRYSIAAAVFLHPVMTLGWGVIFLRSIWFTGFRRQLLWRGRSYDASRTRFGARDDR